MKRLALVGLLWLGMGGVAQGYSHPTALITTLPTQHPYYIWVGEAKVPTPNVTLEVAETSCCVHTTSGSRIIYFPPITQVDPRWSFLHELGHNFDYYTMQDWARRRFLTIIGSPDRPWRDDGANWQSPHERFAEAYAWCALWRDRPHFWKAPDGIVSLTKQQRICRLIDRA